MNDLTLVSLSAFEFVAAQLGWRDSSTRRWHTQLLAAYSDPQRAYHSLEHLEECLALLSLVPGAASPTVAMALWFHDAVYDPRAADNEERSAALAVPALEAGGVEPSVVQKVSELIMLTKTHQADGTDEAALMLSIDLAILGAPRERFDRYEEQIRHEYDWVPVEVYRSKRAEIMAGFLAREPIYHHAWIRERFEAAARENLRRLVSTLMAGG